MIILTTPSRQKQKKVDWRAAKLVEYIYQTQGLYMRMDESLIKSRVNTMQKLMDSNYVPHLTHSKPARA